MVFSVYFVLLSWCWNQPRVRLKPWRCLTIMLVFFPPAREVVSACIACAASLCSPWIFFPPFLIFLFRFVLAVAHRGTYLGPVYLFICAFFLLFCSRLETNSDGRWQWFRANVLVRKLSLRCSFGPLHGRLGVFNFASAARSTSLSSSTASFITRFEARRSFYLRLLKPINRPLDCALPAEYPRQIVSFESFLLCSPWWRKKWNGLQTGRSWIRWALNNKVNSPRKWD